MRTMKEELKRLDTAVNIRCMKDGLDLDLYATGNRKFLMFLRVSTPTTTIVVLPAGERAFNVFALIGDCTIFDSAKPDMTVQSLTEMIDTCIKFVNEI